MTDFDKVALLEQRIKLLETQTGVQSHDTNTIARIDGLNQSLMKVEKDLPDLKPCYALLQSVTPILIVQRSTLRDSVMKAQLLYDQKEAIIKNINNLQAIRTLEPQIMNVSSYEDNEQLMKRLQVVENNIVTMQKEIAQQSQDVDKIVEVYEQTMLYMSKICETWEDQVKSL